MPVSLENKLAGKQSEVVNAIRGGLGISGTMELYGIKSRQTFLRWLREHTNGEWQPGPLAGLKGGKHKWMREHRETILGCLEIFGRERTRDMFCFTKDDTLDRFIRFSGKPFTGKLTRLERVELDNRDLKARVNLLEKQMGKYDIQFSRIDETYRQVTATQIQVSQFEVAVGDRIGGLFTRALQQSLEKFIAPAKEMLPQPPDLNINYLLEQREEASEAKTAEKQARKEAKLVAKEEAKREVREARQRAKREAEEAKKARKAEAIAKKEATLVAQRQTHDTVVKETQSLSPKENPLVETIARLKEG